MLLHSASTNRKYSGFYIVWRNSDVDAKAQRVGLILQVFQPLTMSGKGIRSKVMPLFHTADLHGMLGGPAVSNVF